MVCYLSCAVGDGGDRSSVEDGRRPVARPGVAQQVDLAAQAEAEDRVEQGGDQREPGGDQADERRRRPGSRPGRRRRRPGRRPGRSAAAPGPRARPAGPGAAGPGCGTPRRTACACTPRTAPSAKSAAWTASSADADGRGASSSTATSTTEVSAAANCGPRGSMPGARHRSAPGRGPTAWTWWTCLSWANGRLGLVGRARWNGRSARVSLQRGPHDRGLRCEEGAMRPVRAFDTATSACGSGPLRGAWSAWSRTWRPQ